MRNLGAHKQLALTFQRNQRDHRLITDFVADVGPCQVRFPSLAAKLNCSQLRTKKHNHLAVSWDELGNAFVLTADGRRLNLLHNEIPGQ